jgi:hypothetical protein
MTGKSAQIDCMKNTWISNLTLGCARPARLTVVSVAFAYWVSQMLASYFVGGAILGLNSKLAAFLCLCLFGSLFAVHFIRPCSKSAAILGLCCFGTFMAALGYLSALGPAIYVPTATALIGIPTLLGVAGIVWDVERCREVWTLNPSECPRLSLIQKLIAMLRQAVHANHH